MQTFTKTLGDMMAETSEANRANGWYDKEVTLGEACALLHSEVSEALEAWRQWGLDDPTPPGVIRAVGSAEVRLHKPEGVGSEFADVFIRWLDYCSRFGMDPEQIVLDHYGIYGVNLSFTENINALHQHIARAYGRVDLGDAPDFEFAGIYVFLCQLCEEYDIDLDAEYERKSAYNKTRGYRHGGKRI